MGLLDEIKAISITSQRAVCDYFRIAVLKWRTMATRRKKVFLILIASVIFITVISYFIFIRIMKAPTASMANTIIPGDRLIVTKLFGEIKRGDLIIFKYPEEPSIQYVSRVIGLPGETIEIRGQRVYINNEETPEIRVLVEEDRESFPMREISHEGDGNYRVFHYSTDDEPDFMRMEMQSHFARFGVGKPYQIPEGNYFVMGDNRDDSVDSRFWGTLPENLVTGKVLRISFIQVEWDMYFNRF